MLTLKIKGLQAVRRSTRRRWRHAKWPHIQLESIVAVDSESPVSRSRDGNRPIGIQDKILDIHSYAQARKSSIIGKIDASAGI